MYYIVRCQADSFLFCFTCVFMIQVVVKTMILIEPNPEVSYGLSY